MEYYSSCIIRRGIDINYQFLFNTKILHKLYLSNAGDGHNIKKTVEGVGESSVRVQFGERFHRCPAV